MDEALDIFVQMRAVDKAKGFQRIVEPVNRGSTASSLDCTWAMGCSDCFGYDGGFVLDGSRSCYIVYTGDADTRNYAGGDEGKAYFGDRGKCAFGYVSVGYDDDSGGWRHDPEEGGC